MESQARRDVLRLHEMLSQLCYVSSAVVPFDGPMLRELLEQARAHNQAHALTGILLYSRGHFMQMLEGEPTAVMALFKKIELDPRHHRVMTLFRQSIDARDFGDWSMAYRDLDDPEVRKLPGFREDLNLAFNDPAFLSDGSKARRVLSVFVAEMR
jgi:Sensors of blue-light using FAD